MIIYEILFMHINRDTWNLCSISFSLVFREKKEKVQMTLNSQIPENK